MVLFSLVLFAEGNMIFDYQMYLRSDFFVPLGELVFVTIVIVSSVGSFIRARASGKAASETLLVIVAALFFVVMTSIQIARGIRLLSDSEQDTFEIQGVIEEIEEPPFYTFYYVEGNRKSSQFVIIGGEKYYTVSLSGISRGDEVNLVVFSNSKFVQKAVLIRKATP